MTLQRQLANLSSTSIGATAVGDKWAEMSDVWCQFIMAVEQYGKGRDVRQQLLDLI